MTFVPLLPDWSAVATKRSKEDSQKAEDELMEKNNTPMYVNFIAPCYYIRSSRMAAALRIPLPPSLVVHKDKLRPDQIEFMERKCEETQTEKE